MYALSQVTCLLYSIDPLTRDVRTIGHIEHSGNDMSGLAFNAEADALYSVVNRFDPSFSSLSSELVKVPLNAGRVEIVGTIANGFCESLAWRSSDGHFDAYVVYGSGAWDSPHKSSLVRIDPFTAAMTAYFKTEYHTIAGLARRPGKDAYFSWVNGESHFYAEVDLASKTIIPRGSSDKVGVVSGAMLLRDFYVAPAPNLPCTQGLDARNASAPSGLRIDPA